MLTWKPIGRPSLARSARAQRRGLERSAVLLILGVVSVLGAGLSDLYVHRGVEATTAEIRLQPAGREQGTNIDLRRYPADQLDQVMAVLRQGHLTHVRQLFSWAEIEPTQGTFVWGPYDAIVAAAAAAQVIPIVVLGDTPSWARDPADADAADAPPRSTAAFGTFCAALRLRYAALHLFQVGQALDDPGLWGGRTVDPNEYAALLTVASEQLRAQTSDNYLIAGDIGSTPGARSGRDLDTVAALLGNGRVSQLVDVVSIVADGGDASPFDRRMDRGTTNLSRVVLLREALVDAGYGERPVWITRLGWTGEGGGPAGVERQADLIASGLRRIRSEWSWVDLVLAWEFVPGANEAGSGMALIDGSSPTPIYSAYADFAATPFGESATTGLNAASSPACTFDGNWPEQHLERRLSRVSRDPAATTTCRFWGSGVSLISRYSPSSGSALFQIDGRPVAGWTVEDGWSSVPLSYPGEDPIEASIPLASTLTDGPHTLTVRLADDGELVFGGIVVRDGRSMVWPVAMLLVAGILALALALRGLMTFLGEHLGLLQPRSGVTLLPALPRLTSWQPAARLRGR